MKALSKVDDLGHIGLANHDVVGLEVEVHDFVRFEISDSLNKHEDDIYLREYGHDVLVMLNELQQIRQLHKIYQQVGFYNTLLLRDIIFRQENGISMLYFKQDIALMVDTIYPISSTRILCRIYVPFYHHPFVEHILVGKLLIFMRSYQLIL